MEDRCAAGNGIEARVPFLDRRLVDLATQLPRRLRGTLLWDKHMARCAVDGLLPRHIVFREKKPFYDGRTARFSHQTVLAMLRQQNCALVEQALEAPRMSDFVDPTVLRSAVAGRAAAPVHPELLLRLVNLGLLDRTAAALQPGFHADHVVLRAVPTPPEDLGHTFPDVSLENASVLGLGEATMLARDSTHPRTWLLIDDHRVVFTIDEDQVPEWVKLLTGLDGRASLGQVSRATGVAWESQTEYLQLCLERGYLVARSD
jgi:asparagine synthase (glutamine-hydrolysing)